MRRKQSKVLSSRCCALLQDYASLIFFNDLQSPYMPKVLTLVLHGPGIAFCIYGLFPCQEKLCLLEKFKRHLFGWQHPEKSGKSSLEFNSKEKHAPSPEQR